MKKDNFDARNFVEIQRIRRQESGKTMKGLSGLSGSISPVNSSAAAQENFPSLAGYDFIGSWTDFFWNVLRRCVAAMGGASKTPQDRQFFIICQRN